MTDLAPPDFRALFESAPGNYLVLDPTLRIIAVSDNYLRATMTERAQIIGRGLFEVFPDNPDDATADGVNNLRASLHRVLAKKAPDAMPYQKYDIRRPDSEGGGFEVRYWSPINTPVFDGAGEVGSIIHCVADVTRVVVEEQQRQRAEQELRRSEERFRLLVEGAKDCAIVMLDPDGKVVSWNDGARRIQGYAAEEIIGKPVSTFYPPEEDAAAKLEQELRLAMRDGRVEDEGHRVRKDGSRFWANVVVTPLRDETGALRGFSKMTRDFTERRRALVELRESEERARRMSAELQIQNQRVQEATRMKSEFLANMSHELRTPLNAVIGFAELLYDGVVPPDSPQHAEFLGDILRSGRHLLQLINDILDLSKVEAGKMDFHPETLELERPILEVANILRPIAERKRIALGIELDPALGKATLDSGRLKQVLYNYVSNALKFTAEQGHVTVRARPDGEAHVRIEVQDDGIGIKPEDLKRLFVEFQQLDGGLNKQHGGTGLGLSLTKRMVEAQGGTVGLSSEPGKGSTFFARFPRHPDASEAIRLSPSLRRLPVLVMTVAAERGSASAFTVHEGDGAPIDRQTISSSLQRAGLPPPPAAPVLVVDDDPANLRLMSAAIEQLGHSTLCETSGEHALRAAAERHPSAIVLDLLMPGMNGFEFLDRFRADRSNRDVPVIIWTAKDLTVEERAQLAAGAQGILIKGVDEVAAVLAELRALISPSVNGRGA